MNAIEELKFHEFIQCIDTKVDKHRYKIGLKIVIQSPYVTLCHLWTHALFQLGGMFLAVSALRYVARCRADTELYGKTFTDESEIEDWLEFSLHEAP